MIQRDFKLLIFDNKIQIDKVFGANLRFLKKMIPDYKNIIVDDINLIAKKCSSIIITNNEEEYIDFKNDLNSSFSIINLPDLIFN